MLLQRGLVNRCLIYEDDNGYCRIIIPGSKFKQDWETEDMAIGRLYHSSIPDVCEFFACDCQVIPVDTTFRDAWKKGCIEEPIKIDLEKAISIHRERLRQVAQKKIDQLNIELEIATENQNLPQQVSITKTKKILRTIHEMNLTHCKNTEHLKTAIPRELRDVWHFYAMPAA